MHWSSKFDLLLSEVYQHESFYKALNCLLENKIYLNATQNAHEIEKFLLHLFLLRIAHFPMIFGKIADILNLSNVW